MDAMSSCEGIKVQWTAFKPQLSLNAQTGFITTNKGSSSDQGGNQGTSRTPSLSFDGFTTDGPAYSLALALTQRRKLAGQLKGPAGKLAGQIKKVEEKAKEKEAAAAPAPSAPAAA